MSNNVAPKQVLLLGTVATTGIVSGVTSGTSIWIPSSAFGICTIYFRSVGTTSGGTLLIEESDWMPGDQAGANANTASQIASVSASAFTGGVQQAYHITNSAYGYVRVRISSAITGGGSVIVTLRAQGAGA